MAAGAESGGRKRRQIAGFELVRRLGRGSMGAVFLARQISLDRKVAIKILAPRLAKNEKYVRRFVREAKAAASLNHTNVVSAIDVGEEGGYRYFVMEYVAGPTVEEILERGSMDEKRAVGIVIQVTGALEHAFRNGFVHRDIKPSNIIMTPKGIAKLCDLGLAKEVEGGVSDTQDGQMMGTPDYISPEQGRGDGDVDIRADIYSLGATLFHMVTGRVPYPGPNPAVVVTKHLNEPVPDPRAVNPAVTPETARVVMKMMAKDPAARYQTPGALLLELLAVQDGTARKPLPKLKSRRAKWRRRRFQGRAGRGGSRA